jgi:hypothetical protein
MTLRLVILTEIVDSCRIPVFNALAATRRCSAPNNLSFAQFLSSAMARLQRGNKVLV